MGDAFEPSSSIHALRLGHALLLNALLLASAWRFTRLITDPLQRLSDTLLLWLTIQYASVMLCGAVGGLNAWTMTGAAVLMCAGLWITAIRWRVRDAALLEPQPTAARMKMVLPYASVRAPQPRLAWERCLAFASTGFLLGYAGAVLWNQYFIAVMSDDALTYHVPAAVRWLQTGRITLHETWFFNPANTWSPLAGSAFIAWWFAPLGNDWLARFVQAPALALIFVSMIRLARLLGAPLSVAVLVALATALSRPFMRQIIVTKDDLYLAAFFLTAIVALAQHNLTDPLAPWRLGISLGLFLATKYTALLALPMLLLIIDAPLRAKWKPRQWLIAIAVTTLIAAPWFIRNGWLTGNPLFPIDVNLAGLRLFEGLFTTTRSEQLRTFRGLWHVLTGTYFSMPWPLFLTLLLGFGAALVVARQRILHDPLVRACILGPVLGIALFALASPYAEVRFVDPAFLLLFVSIAIALMALPLAFALPLALVLFILGIQTGFTLNRWTFVLTFVAAGAIVATVSTAAAVFHDRLPRLSRRGLPIAAALATFALAAYLYVHHDTDVRHYRQLTDTVWKSQYGEIADAWAFVRAKLPDDAVLAYTNTQFAYPLMGFEGNRRIAYAPTRSGLTALHTLPRLDAPLPGEQLVQQIAHVTISEPDRAVWLDNLRQTGAQYLFIARTGVVQDPPELTFARRDPAQFEPLFDNPAAIVYRIRWPGN